ncbi:MAG TPA: hypothetical protein VFU13_02840 [Steroidobacteraceae bacterium]|nr:hypothetical protein [Steroidobacteraceae bacterium]
MLEPRNQSSSNVMRMSVTVDFLIPEPGQQVSSAADYLPIFDRQRLRQAPRAQPLERFGDITVRGKVESMLANSTVRLRDSGKP